MFMYLNINSLKIVIAYSDSLQPKITLVEIYLASMYEILIEPFLQFPGQMFMPLIHYRQDVTSYSSPKLVVHVIHHSSKLQLLSF